MRITATAGPGRGALLSIEREADLSGPIHNKGFLTLSGYLRERYGQEQRIAVGATLTFEQSYEQIDGDSAASAELYALLSELSGLPVRQDIAVTGSVNQHGEVRQSAASTRRSRVSSGRAVSASSPGARGSSSLRPTPAT